MPYRIEDVARLLLEGQHEVAAEDDAHLLLLDALLRLDPAHHAHDDVRVALVRLDLRPLTRARHILEGERVQLELGAELAQQIHVVHALDVDPDAAFRALAPDLLHRARLDVLQRVLVEHVEPNRYGRAALRPGVDDRAGWGARLLLRARAAH